MSVFHINDGGRSKGVILSMSFCINNAVSLVFGGVMFCFVFCGPAWPWTRSSPQPPTTNSCPLFLNHVLDIHWIWKQLLFLYKLTCIHVSTITCTPCPLCQMSLLRAKVLQGFLSCFFVCVHVFSVNSLVKWHVTVTINRKHSICCQCLWEGVGQLFIHEWRLGVHLSDTEGEWTWQ